MISSIRKIATKVKIMYKRTYTGLFPALNGRSRGIRPLSLNRGLDIELYSTNFDTGVADTFPTGWTRSTVGAIDPTLLWTNNDVNTTTSTFIANSNGYTNASGNFGLVAINSESIGAVASMTLAGQVSTTGYENIRVKFGYAYYETTPDMPPFVFEWSDDGASWTAITIPVVPTNGSWSLQEITLASGANNKSNLRFRYSYDLNVAGGGAEWIRAIDDFSVIGDEI